MRSTCFRLLLLALASSVCGPPDARDEPPAVPGPVAQVVGRVMRGDRPVAGVHALGRFTYGRPCSAANPAPGGTTVLMTPTGPSGYFQASAYPGAGVRGPGCLYVGAADPATGDTAWASPRIMVPQVGGSTTRFPVLEIDVPWGNGNAGPKKSPTPR